LGGKSSKSQREVAFVRIPSPVLHVLINTLGKSDHTGSCTRGFLTDPPFNGLFYLKLSSVEINEV